MLSEHTLKIGMSTPWAGTQRGNVPQVQQGKKINDIILHIAVRSNSTAAASDITHDCNIAKGRSGCRVVDRVTTRIM